MFGYTDSVTRAQRLAISWTLDTPRDQFTDRPDERDEGFFPSLDPEAAGYIGDDPTDVDGTKQQARYESQLRKAKRRLADWRADRWHYVGVVARAVIFIPLGGTSFRVLELRSAGLWGIESDAGEYLASVYAEQKAELRAELGILCGALAGGTFDEEESA